LRRYGPTETRHQPLRAKKRATRAKGGVGSFFHTSYAIQGAEWGHAGFFLPQQFVGRPSEPAHEKHRSASATALEDRGSRRGRRCDREERIDDAHAVVILAMIHVLAIDGMTAEALGRGENGRVPVADLKTPLNVHRVANEIGSTWQRGLSEPSLDQGGGVGAGEPERPLRRSGIHEELRRDLPSLAIGPPFHPSPCPLISLKPAVRSCRSSRL